MNRRELLTGAALAVPAMLGITVPALAAMTEQTAHASQPDRPATTDWESWLLSTNPLQT